VLIFYFFTFIARSLIREVLLILLLLKRWPSSLVSLCKSLGLQNVVLEGDAKAVFDALQASNECGGRFGHLVDALQVSLEYLKTLRFQFVFLFCRFAFDSLSCFVVMLQEKQMYPTGFFFFFFLLRMSYPIL
jgi:hypothetical protein